MRKGLIYSVIGLLSILAFSCEKEEKRESSYVDATSLVTQDGASVYISLDGVQSNTKIDQIELQVSKSADFNSYNSYKGSADNSFVLDDLEGATVYYYRFSFGNPSDKMLGMVNQFTTTQTVVNISTETFTANGISFKMVKVDGGSFVMGNSSSQMGDGDSDEANSHNVKLDGYYIGQTEVTQALWNAVIGSNPSYFQGVNLPVEMVSYNDCLTFIAKLNALTNKTFRLPTEAEWEFAARGGMNKNSFVYAGSSNVFDVAWIWSNSEEMTHPVAKKKANSLGLYDMSGNVMEWCSDWYGTYDTKDLENPQGPATGMYRVLRGGSWAHDAVDARVKNRDAYEPNSLYNDFGLRLAMDLPVYYTLTLTASEGGSVLGGGSYLFGQSVEIEAVAQSGYKFEGWSDGDSSAIRTITLTENLNLTAKFVSDGSQNQNATDGIYTVNGVTFKMVYVAGGTFTMGATSEQGSDAYDSEKPTHSVTLSDYYMGETEVTQALWEAVMGTNTSSFSGSNLPVESVSWNDCQDFVRKLNALTGADFRLPTEAEWEYAARGGSKSRGYKYSGGNTIDDVAWYDVNSSHPVGTKLPNELGLYDMSGNVWEWCSDWYGSYSSSSSTNPTGPSSGSSRVYRGGSWSYYAGFCRVSIRGGNCGDWIIGLGLRLARSSHP